jgi:hypothetical protein
MAAMLVAGLTCVAWPDAQGGPTLSPLAHRLLVPPSAQLVTGLGTVALGLAGQLALLIGWGRSRSLVDYAGQYRIWTRAGLACWLFAGVSRLGLHSDWRDWALTQNWPRFWNDTQLLVLLPTVWAGASLGAGLRREVARCQPSRTLLMMATTLYLTVVALLLGSGSSLSTAHRLLAIQNGMLAAHLTLLLCFWIHARHVLYVSCDPVGESRRSKWLPTPWFIRWHRRAPQPGTLADERTNLEASEAIVLDGDDGARECDHPPKLGDRTEERTDLVGEVAAPTFDASFEPVARPAKPRRAPLASPRTKENGVETGPDQGAVDGAEQVFAAQRELSGEGQPASQTEDFALGDDQPSLKGLSKRERRRLLQEERLKGRADRG